MPFSASICKPHGEIISVTAAWWCGGGGGGGAHRGQLLRRLVVQRNALELGAVRVVVDERRDLAYVSQRRVSEPGRTDSVGVSVGADGPLTTLTRNLLSSYLLSHSFLKAFAPLNCGYARALRDEEGRGGRSSSWASEGGRTRFSFQPPHVSNTKDATSWPAACWGARRRSEARTTSTARMLDW